MPRPWRIRYAGAKYHAWNRGNGRQEIFLSDGDRQRFLRQLESALEQDDVLLFAYVLMPNHYHLYLQTTRGNIQRFMQRLNTAYGMYFRYKHHRPGHCFQGRYKAKLVAGDDYSLRITRYLHLNPVKTEEFRRAAPGRKQKYLEGFRWSSYRGYAGLCKPEEIVDYRHLELTERRTDRGRKQAYKRYVESMLSSDDEVLKGANEASRYAIGDERFVEQVEEDLRRVEENRRVAGGDIEWPERDPVAFEQIMAVAAAGQKASLEELYSRSRRSGQQKRIAIELCCRHSGLRQREIARRFGYGSESAIGKQRRLLAQELRSDKALAQRLARLSKQVGKTANF